MMVEISNKKAVIFDTSVKHSDRCKCKNCRLKKEAPKLKILLPIDIKKYFPVFVINPFVSFIFISKLFEAINSKYLDSSFDPSNITLHSYLQEIINENFSKDFINCLNFLISRDIFNAVGYFEENIDKFEQFEMFYLSGIINFYLQNLDKAYENIISAFESRFGIPISNFSEEIETNEPNLLFLFDMMVISLYSKKNEIFSQIFEYLIKQNNEFSFYTFMFFIFLLYYVSDTYILLENIVHLQDNLENVGNIIANFENSNTISAYLLYILMCISNYRPEIYNVLMNEINSIAKTINPNITTIDDFSNTLNICCELDKDNLLYKIALHSIDRNKYKEIISMAEFLPLNKTIANFIDYVKFADILTSKLITFDIGLETNFVKIKELVESEPNNPFFWLLNGLKSFAMKDFDIANNYFRGAVATDNNLIEARIFFSTTLLLTGEIEKSLKILENSVNTYNSFLYDIVLINMASIYKLLGKYNFVNNILQELANLESIEIMKEVTEGG